MGRTVLLQDRFTGVKQDLPRDQLPAGSLWYATDMLPSINAKLRERGGYSYASANIAAVVATASYVIGGIHAPFVAASKNCVIDEDGNLVTVADDVTITDAGVFSGGAVTDVGAFVIVSQNPVFHRDKVIAFAAGGATAPKKYTGSAISALGGSPPNAIYATVFTDRTVAGRTTAQPQRLYFSAAGNPESWDTTNSYIDLTYPITGLASLRTAILIFHDGYVSRIRGYTPPTVAGGSGDFAVDDPIWNVGCSDARSIAYWGDQIIFADGEGIYTTDGAGVDDLTRRCGMKRYWQNTIMAGYTSKVGSIAGGVLRDHYIITVINGINTFQGGAVIDLRNLAWWPITNLDFTSMWSKQAAVDELYAGRRGAARIASLASIFVPAASVRNDGDGDVVAGTVETPYYRGKPGEKGWRRLFLTHYLADYATDNPTVAVSYVKTPEATSYAAITGSLTENTAEDRKPKSLGFSSDGVAFKLTRANAGDWRLSSIEADVHTREGSR